jgi:hypothetical protein
LSFPSRQQFYLSRSHLPPPFWLSAHHLCVSIFLSPQQTMTYRQLLQPPPPSVWTPHSFYSNFFSLHPPLTQPHFTQTPASQPLVCSLHPMPRHHPCYPPTMPHSKPLSPLTPVITPTLHDHPRTNLVPWKIAINRAARGVFAEWDAFGFLFSVCDYAVWAVLNTPPGQQLRVRPDFPIPADLQANAGPAARDAFKRATDARAACSAALCVAILDSLGESTRLAISDPETHTFHLSPRDIINATTVLHGALTGVEVDALRRLCVCL